MDNQKAIGGKKGPAYIHSEAKGWYCTPSRSLYVSDSGAIARRINPGCASGCLKKFQVRHPNLKVADKLIRAAAKLDDKRLDLHVCGHAEKLLSKAEPADDIVAPPMKMCIQCGELATLADPCPCGNSMEDKEGRVLINVSQYEQDGTRIKASLNMPGYPKMRISFRKESIPGSDLLQIRESEKETIAIRVPAEPLKTQLRREKK